MNLNAKTYRGRDSSVQNDGGKKHKKYNHRKHTLFISDPLLVPL